ncbi:SRPBCC domain-containing protein [Telmatospirillum sp. J64-1]|uniref:SRPBCC domain-containing protein n=1 Tax=Telmatospirillum sp. J64-1 TaxID=2502183 RepID=UPI00115E22EC|nr:SRPBCC domain-containing protein [Telmatospirillum sp. J64-1]
MALDFRVSGRIGRPVDEVFAAIAEPKKLSSYFTTVGGASAPLVKGTDVLWWGETVVSVQDVVVNERIVLSWNGGTSEQGQPYSTRVEITFTSLEDGGTLVTIAESGWEETAAGQRSAFTNCEGWTQMLCSMKGWLEYGINLREGYYPSEMKGQPAREIAWTGKETRNG